MKQKGSIQFIIYAHRCKEVEKKIRLNDRQAYTNLIRFQTRKIMTSNLRAEGIKKHVKKLNCYFYSLKQESKKNISSAEVNKIPLHL